MIARQVGMILMGALVFTAGCCNDARSSKINPKEDPVTLSARSHGPARPSFTVDARYRPTGSRRPPRVEVVYAFDAALAIPVAYVEEGSPAPKVPKVFTTKMPVVIDLTATTNAMIADGTGLAMVRSLELFAADRTTRLASYIVGTTCAYSQTSTFSLATDIGAVHTTTEHLRMALANPISKALFAKPDTEAVLVALDAEGRTVAAETFTGHASSSSLYVDAREISWDTDDLYDAPSRLYSWRFDATLGADEPVSKPLPTDARSRRVVPASRTRKAPMVLDISCRITTGTASKPPIAAIATVYIFDASSVLLKTYSAKESGVYSRGEDSGWGSDGSREAFTYEHLRIGLSSALADPLKKDSSLSLRFVAVDAKGRTITTGFPNFYP